MKIIKTIFNIIYWLIILVVVSVSAVTAFTIFKIPGERKLLVVQSGSMEPTLKIGSVVLIQKKDTYSNGEIITFRGKNANDTTTHRIIKSELVNGREIFATKGDANQGEDREEVTTENILGKTVLVIPYLGFAVSFTKTQLGFIVLVVIPAVIIVFSEIFNIKKEILELIEKRKKPQIAA